MSSCTAFFDIDGTIIRGQSQKILVKYLFNKGYINYLLLLRLYLWFVLYKFHIVSDPRKPLEMALSVFKGLNIKEVDAIVRDYFNEVLVHLIYPEAVKEITNHLRKGHPVILLSNSIEIIVKKLANHLGIRQYSCTRLKVASGKYTGKINGDIMYGVNKLNYVKNLSRKYNITLSDCYLYTDHYSDFNLLAKVGHPVLVNPDDKLLRLSADRGWPTLRFNI